MFRFEQQFQKEFSVRLFFDPRLNYPSPDKVDLAVENFLQDFSHLENKTSFAEQLEISLEIFNKYAEDGIVPVKVKGCPQPIGWLRESREMLLYSLRQDKVDIFLELGAQIRDKYLKSILQSHENIETDILLDAVLKAQVCLSH